MASGKGDAKQIEGMLRLDAITALQDQLTSLRKILGAFNVSVIQFQPQVCNLCGGCHSSGECQVGQANYVNNFQKSNNPYSSTYTPAWKNHPNLSWETATTWWIPTTSCSTNNTHRHKRRNQAWRRDGEYWDKDKKFKKPSSEIKHHLYIIWKFIWGKLLAYSLQEHKDHYQETSTNFQKSKYMRSP